MPTNPTRLARFEIFLLILLAAIWGGSFLFIRIASPLINPIWTTWSRVALGSAVLLIAARSAKQSLQWGQNCRMYVILGLFNAAIPFSLIAWAALTLNASVSSILNAATTFFTALVSAIWLKEKLKSLQWLGIWIGIFGVALLSEWFPITASSPFEDDLNLTMATSFLTPLTTVFAASLAMLLANLHYALCAVWLKTWPQGTAPLAFAAGQQFAAAVFLLPLAIGSWPGLPAWQPKVVFAVLALGVFSSALGYYIFFVLLARIGATRTLTVTLLIPAFGVLWGHLFLAESLAAHEILGFIIILIGMLLVLQIRLNSFLK